MKKFLVIDYEFTMYRRPVGRPRGFFPEIIEIGAVVLDENGKRISELQNFVKPHFYPKHAKEAMEFCMIKPEDMKSGIEFAEMIDMSLSYVSKLEQGLTSPTAIVLYKMAKVLEVPMEKFFDGIDVCDLNKNKI